MASLAIVWSVEKSLLQMNQAKSAAIINVRRFIMLGMMATGGGIIVMPTTTMDGRIRMMLEMRKEPIESDCEIARCKAVGVTNRSMLDQSPILLCNKCARVWDKAHNDLMRGIRAANKRR